MKNYLTEKNNNGNYLFDDMFNDFFKPVFYKDNADYMATDVKEHEHSYELEIDMPGYDKKDISVDFEKGYLTVSAKKEQVLHLLFAFIHYCPAFASFLSTRA